MRRRTYHDFKHGTTIILGIGSYLGEGMWDGAQRDQDGFVEDREGEEGGGGRGGRGGGGGGKKAEDTSGGSRVGKRSAKGRASEEESESESEGGDSEKEQKEHDPVSGEEPAVV